MADGPDPGPEAPAPRAEQSDAGGRDLNAALLSTFSMQVQEPPFPDRVAELCQALTNTRHVSVWLTSDADAPARMLAASGAAPNTDAIETALAAVEADQGAGLAATADHFIAALALPTGWIGRLVVTRPAGGANAQGLAYERVAMLSHISFAQFRNPDLQGQEKLVKAINQVAAGQVDQLQRLVDALARLTGADYAAAGLVRDGRVADVKLSGQDGFTKRADLPARVRQDLTRVATQRLQSPDRAFGPGATRDSGLALLVNDPRRGRTLLPLAAALFALAPQHNEPRRWTAKRVLRIAAVLAVIAGAGFIPIPDGTSVTAQVEAEERRILTAPFTSVVQSVEVADRAAVMANDVVVTLDTQELDLELIGLQSDRAAAVIEQENARLGGNAAGLRNAEIAVERFDARIALLETQKAAAQVRTPIAGVTDLVDLKQRVGTTVRQGDTLLEVSDPTRLHLALSIPERQIGKLAAGAAGQFRPDFDPTLRLEVRISTVSPAIDLTAELPVALAWAEFDGATDGLRPGLQGVVVVGGTFTPAGRVVYRSLRDWLLLRFWI